MSSYTPSLGHLRVPEGFPSLLEGLTREILRNQPENIYEFAATYFQCLAMAKSVESESKSAEIDIDLSDPEVGAAAVKIQKSFRRFRETKKTEATVPDDKPIVEKEEVAISTEAENIDIDLKDPDVEKAALTLQAGFRGFKTRKSLREEKKLAEAQKGDEDAAVKVEVLGEGDKGNEEFVLEEDENGGEEKSDNGRGNDEQVETVAAEENVEKQADDIVEVDQREQDVIVDEKQQGNESQIDEVTNVENEGQKENGATEDVVEEKVSESMEGEKSDDIETKSAGDGNEIVAEVPDGDGNDVVPNAEVSEETKREVVDKVDEKDNDEENLKSDVVDDGDADEGDTSEKVEREVIDGNEDNIGEVVDDDKKGIDISEDLNQNEKHEEAVENSSGIAAKDATAETKTVVDGDDVRVDTSVRPSGDEEDRERPDRVEADKENVLGQDSQVPEGVDTGVKETGENSGDNGQTEAVDNGAGEAAESADNK